MVDRSLVMTNHDPRMMRQELEQIREWAIEMLAAGTEPPWSWYQYMKLREASESILAGWTWRSLRKTHRNRHYTSDSSAR
jgi:hypothetical protein